MLNMQRKYPWREAQKGPKRGGDFPRDMEEKGLTGEKDGQTISKKKA